MADTQKLRVDIPLLLPEVPHVHDRCVDRLVDVLEGRPGIEQVHVVEPNGQAAQLCVHYDPGVISLGRVRELAQAAGAKLTDRFGHLLVRGIKTLHAREAGTLTARLQSLDGVVEAEAATGGAVRIEYDREKILEEALLARLQEMGVRLPRAGPQAVHRQAEPEQDEAHGHEGQDHAPGEDHLPSAAMHKAHEAHEDAHKEGGEHAEHSHAGHDRAHCGAFGEKSELAFALIAGGFLLVGWLMAWRQWVPSWAPIACFVGAYLFGGFFTVREAMDNLKAKRFEIDTLMLVAAAGAAALGRWAEGALLLFLFSLGHSLEHYAMGRARRAIEALAKLAPERALVRRGDKTEEVGVGALKVGDVVVVKPNERMPADGFVTRGQSSVNQAPVTGESVPVDKRPVGDAMAALAGFDKLPAAHRVFAGTINGAGALDVTVARKSTESTMARVVKLVTEAEAQRSPTQNFTEKFERLFVPAVLALVGALMFAWVVVDEPFANSFYRAMAVLVAASPCALAISVPSAVLSGVARAGRSGVLVKGGGPLENLGSLVSIAFDKTGTLTEGKPRLTDVVAAEGATNDELLRVALAVEEHSDHPLASAVVAGAQEKLGAQHQPLEADALESITGRGVKATVDGQVVHVGKAALFTEIEGTKMPQALANANERLVADGRTTMIVRQGERYLGVLGVMDTPRPAAAQVMKQLQALGIRQLIMISGDNQKVADSVAKSVGLTEARGDLMPEDKVTAIKELRSKAGKVAMVGDGVNDAPAMANATVGIAMGAAGSDVALETADVALMADDLAQLPFAVGLSRRTSRVIKQNLWVSLGVVAVLIPAAILGLNIGTAVIFHEGSTLLVVMNALRLLAFELPAPAQTSETHPKATQRRDPHRLEDA